MEIISKNKTRKNKNATNCYSLEYPSKNKDINGAIVKLNGKYPKIGKVTNLKCKELIYILSGSGKIIINNKENEIKNGDIILINKKEKYILNGKLSMFVACTPSWNKKQHKWIK